MRRDFSSCNAFSLDALTLPRQRRNEILVFRCIVSNTVKALVCEDDAAIRTLLITLLARDSFEVEVATNGNEAIEALSGGDEYALVVLDLMMPKASGYDVLAHLQTSRPEMLRRVIILTAAAMAARGEFPYEVATVIVKPFDVLELGRLARSVAADRAAS